MNNYDIPKYLNDKLASDLMRFLAAISFNNKIDRTNKDVINILSSENEIIRIPLNYTLWDVFILLFPDYKDKEQEILEMLNNLISERYFMKLFTIETFFECEISALSAFALDYTSDKGKYYLQKFEELEKICPLNKPKNY